MSDDTISFHCAVMLAIMAGIALFLHHRGLFCPARTGFWVWLSLFLSLVLNPAVTLMSGDYNDYRHYTSGTDVTEERVYWVLINVAVGVTAFFLTYLWVRPASLPRARAQAPASLALVSSAPFLVIGFSSILFNIGPADPGVQIINGKYVGSVTGWRTGCTNFVIYPCLLFMFMPRLRILGAVLGALYVTLRVEGEAGARYSIVVLPLAVALYMTIKQGRRWPSIPAAGVVAALLALLVARGHMVLRDMDARDLTAWSVLARAVRNIGQGTDTGMLPTFYRESDLVDRLGFTYGLNTVQYVLFGPLPRKYFPWKSDVFAFVPGVQLHELSPEKVQGAKSSIIGAFYVHLGILGVVLGMGILAFFLRKLDGILDRDAPLHVLVWAAMMLAGVWMGVLGNVEWWYQDAMVCSAPFLMLLGLKTARERWFVAFESGTWQSHERIS